MPPSVPEPHKKESSIGKWILVLSSAALYRILLLNGNYDWYLGPVLPYFFQSPEGQHIQLQLFLVSIVFLLFGFFLTDSILWVMLALTMVPLEFSKPFLSLPKFSPLDYFCAVAILVLFLRRGPVALWRQARQTFGDWSLWLWIGFFVYSLVIVHLWGGTARGPFRWIGFLFLYFLSAETAKKHTSWPWYLCALLAWLGTAVALDGLHQFWEIPSYVRLQGLFLQHNIFSAYLSLCLPAMALYTRFPSRVPVLLRWLMLLCAVTAFLLSYSRGAWLGLAVGSFCIAVPRWMSGFSTKFHRRIGLVLAAALLALAFGVTLQPSGRAFLSYSDRQIYLHTGLRILKIHPWMGLGPGNYSSHISTYLSESERELLKTDAYSGRAILFWQHLHNLYLQQLVDLGLVGFTLWAGGLGILVWRALRRRRDDGVGIWSIKSVLSISIIAFLVHNLVDIVTVNSFDMVFAVLLATVTFAPPMDLTGTNV